MESGWVFLLVAAMATGAIVGTLSGLFGVGGGIIMVPVLDTALILAGVPVETSMRMAVATSLATVVPTSIASARAHHQRGAVDLAVARGWALAIGIGAVLGSLLATRVDGAVLTVVFGVVAAVVAIKMLLPLDQWTFWPKVPGGLLGQLVPAAIGSLSSMMGIGGGTLSVPTLTLMSMPVHRAVGTANLLGLAIAIPGTLIYLLASPTPARAPALTVGLVSLSSFVLLVPTAILMAPIGARLAHRLPRRTLSAAFGVFLLIVAGRMVYRSIA